MGRFLDGTFLSTDQLALHSGGHPGRPSLSRQSGFWALAREEGSTWAALRPQGGFCPLRRESRGPGSSLGPCLSWSRGGGAALPGFSVSHSLRLLTSASCPSSWATAGVGGGGSGLFPSQSQARGLTPPPTRWAGPPARTQAGAWPALPHPLTGFACSSSPRVCSASPAPPPTESLNGGRRGRVLGWAESCTGSAGAPADRKQESRAGTGRLASLPAARRWARPLPIPPRRPGSLSGVRLWPRSPEREGSRSDYDPGSLSVP